MKTLVIMPTYGRIPFLPRALASFLSQTYDDKELVIINDDANITITCSYSKVTCINLTKKILIGQKKNLATNLGYHDLYIPHDDDDVFLPNRIEQCVKVHKEHPEINYYWNQKAYLLYGDDFYIDNNTINAMSYTRKGWFEAGGYAHPVNSGEDKEFAEKMPRKLIVSDESIVDYVYQYGGVNYHLTYEKDATIEQIANRQLMNMGLHGKKYEIQPDFDEYKKFVQMHEIYQKTKKPVKLNHISLGKIEIKGPN